MVESIKASIAALDGPPLSPILLFGMTTRIFPLWLVQRVTDLIATRLLLHHPETLERMGDIGTGTAVLEPTDFPYGIQITFGHGRPRVSAYRRGATAVKGDVLVKAPLGALAALADGSTDGDALFFSRSLAISGNVELIIALRNILDAADVDLITQIALPPGSAREFLLPVMSWAKRLSTRISGDLTILQSALLQPARLALANQAQATARLEQRSRTLEKELALLRGRTAKK